MSQNKPSDALTKPRRPLLVGGLIAGAVIALGGLGAGAYAITQAVTADTIQVAETDAPAGNEPTQEPTPEPNVVPTANFRATAVDGLTITLDGSGATDVDGEIVAYAWTFGDGGTGSGATLSHAYAAYGTYTITLTVTDDAGESGSVSAAVEIAAPPPPPPPSGPVFGQYPAGYPVPFIPGTDQPDTTACASSSAYTGSDGVAYCA
jgi:PKD repeat protein